MAEETEEEGVQIFLNKGDEINFLVIVPMAVFFLASWRRELFDVAGEAGRVIACMVGYVQRGVG